MMEPEQLTFAVAVELLREMKANGGVGRISRRLKRTPNYFSKWRKEFSLAKFMVLAEALESMEIQPAGFFARAFADYAPCGDYVAELAAELLDTDAEDMSQELDTLITALADALSYGEGEAKPTTAAAEPATVELLAPFDLRWALRGQESGELGKEWLEVQDEIRHVAAPAVVATLSERVEEIDPELIPFGLGVLGSALRLDFYFAKAEASIRRGLECADEVMDHSAAGRLYQRLSVVFSDRGNFNGALLLNNSAIARYVDGGDLDGVARARVDRGIFTSHMGYFEWSNQAFSQALEALPASENRGRASALNGMAHNYTELKELPCAIRHIREAEKVPVDRLGSAKISWACGAILAKAKHYKEALPRLGEARMELQELAPVDASLVTIDICEVCLLADQPIAACREARTMLQFIEPLRARTPLAEAAAVELAAAGARGERLTLAALEAARAHVRAKPVKR